MGNLIKFLVLLIVLNFFNQIKGQEKELIGGHVVSLMISKRKIFNWFENI